MPAVRHLLAHPSLPGSDMLRRAFLRLSTGALTATFWSLAGCTQVPEPSPALSDPATLGAFADDSTLRDMGRAYLDRVPREARTSRLVRALLEDGHGGLMDQDDPEALRRFLLDRVRADFDANRTVVADGWVLARTEARQAALFSLTR
jgi:hypothetical protein